MQKIKSGIRLSAALLLAMVGLGAMSVSAAVTVNTSFDGSGKTGWAPPDPNAAVGPNNIVQLVNSKMVIMDKSGNVISSTDMGTFWGGSTVGDPHVIYNEITGRFAVEEIKDLNKNGTGHCYFAVSSSSDPTGPWTQITIPVPGFWDGYGGNGIGYNADAYVVHVNGFRDQFAMIPSKNNPNLSYSFVSAPAGMHLGMPVPMTDGNSGGPFFFVSGNDDGVNGQGITAGTLEIVKILNITSASRTFTDYSIQVNNDHTSVINTSWRSKQLVATGTMVPSGQTQKKVSWYLLDTSVSPPALLQNGYIAPPDGGDAIHSSIAISPGGDIGVNYLSIGTSTMNTYVSGRTSANGANTMQASVLVVSGPQSNGRTGDYSSCVSGVDSNGNPTENFWGCNEYMNSTSQGDWGTSLFKFTVN